MAEPVRIRIVPGEYGDNVDTAAKLSPRILTATMIRILVRGEANIQKETPVGWSGALRGGYSHDIRRANTSRPVGVITNPILYHDAAEEGRRPGKPPPTSALIPWVATKLGVPPDRRQSVAFLVARKIGRHGTAGARMVEKGWKRTRRETRSELRKAGLALVRATR